MNVAPFARRKALFAALIVAIALLPQLLYAYPTSRIASRMIWDKSRGFGVLFGGATQPDSALVRYPLNDTWEWNGTRWIQRFPVESPSIRFAHGFVYDTGNDRGILFGGANREGMLGDTWSYKDGAWTPIDAATPPAARRYHAMAWDPVRKVAVVHGGNTNAADITFWTGDTWEFNGTAWTRIVENGPALQSPMLEYDRRAGEMLLLGQNSSRESEMYRLTATGWSKITPTNLPKCVGQGSLIYMNHTNSVFLVGGTCSNTAPTDDTYEWNGTDWRELGAQPTQGYVTAFALTYDPIRMEMILFGGDEYGARNSTYKFRDNSWRVIGKTWDPGPRSMYVFEQDPVHGVGWLFGGFNDNVNFGDLWKYSNGVWERTLVTGTPIGCTYPVAAWDENRNRLVMTCETDGAYEFDGATWTAPPANLSKKPATSKFAEATYDASSKRVAVFGGFDGINYLRNLWFWDGKEWKEATRDNSPRGRALSTFFYDPNSKRLIVFGGIGRKTTEDRIERYGDTFAFDGSKWTQLKPATSPSPRYGAFVEWDPVAKRIVMFGGKDENEKYINEQWEWDGNTWIKRDGGTRPSARMNGEMIFDPVRQQMTLYGGYAGAYYSEVWVYDGTNWEVIPDRGERRRMVGTHEDVAPTSRNREMDVEPEPVAEPEAAPAGLRERIRGIRAARD